ncbi:MAG: hypothetical protein RLZZ522_468 [Verrucomicrobiota bacterium]
MKRLLLLFAASLLASSCVPSTPQSRIEEHPERFAALSPKDQELVRQGTLAKGMPRDAVLLAWGAPAQRFEGCQSGKTSERWDYAGTYPVYTQGFYGGFGAGYGRYRPYGYGVGPEVTYVPYRSGSVWFANSLVDSWERSR